MEFDYTVILLDANTTAVALPIQFVEDVRSQLIRDGIQCERINEAHDPGNTNYDVVVARILAHADHVAVRKSIRSFMDAS